MVDHIEIGEYTGRTYPCTDQEMLHTDDLADATPIPAHGAHQRQFGLGKPMQSSQCDTACIKGDASTDVEEVLGCQETFPGQWLDMASPGLTPPAAGVAPAPPAGLRASGRRRVAAQRAQMADHPARQSRRGPHRTGGHAEALSIIRSEQRLHRRNQRVFDDPDTVDQRAPTIDARRRPCRSSRPQLGGSVPHSSSSADAVRLRGVRTAGLPAIRWPKSPDEAAFLVTSSSVR